jgi:hypothetical protein
MRIGRRSSRWFIVGDRLVGRSAELATTPAVCIATAAWANVCRSPRQMNNFGNGRIATSRHLILGSFADLAPSSRPLHAPAVLDHSRTLPQRDGLARPIPPPRLPGQSAAKRTPCVRIVTATFPALIFWFPFGVVSVPVTRDAAIYVRGKCFARRRVGQKRASAPQLASPHTVPHYLVGTEPPNEDLSVG